MHYGGDGAATGTKATVSKSQSGNGALQRVWQGAERGRNRPCVSFDPGTLQGGTWNTFLAETAAEERAIGAVLEHKVHSMAVKTNFTPTDFEQILSKYDIGEYVRFKPFEQGADQTNLLLTTTKREAVLRYYEKRTLDYAKFEIELLHYLAQNSYPCAAPLATQQGTYIGTYENKPFALFEFVPGEHSDNQENYLQVAEAIGQLHALTIHYKPNDGLTQPTYNQAYCWSWRRRALKESRLKRKQKNVWHG